MRQRGSLTVWFTDEANKAWQVQPHTTKADMLWYWPLVILTALTLRAVFHLVLCQTESLIGCVIGLLGLALAVPDHSTLSRRAETLEGPRPRPRVDGGPLHLLVDSAGLELCGAGEWLLEEHGAKTRWSWRKLHIGLDADTGQIVAVALTTKELDDGAEVSALLNQVPGPLGPFTADGAYDQDGVSVAVTQRRAERDGCDYLHAARPPYAKHRRAWMGSLAESLRPHEAGSGRGGHWQVQAGDR